LEIDLSTI
jgi:hypothetical protein